MKFVVNSKFKPTGDQPKAIEALTKSIKLGNSHQTLIGVTGSGKTFTIANAIEKLQMPTLVISHNKTLAGQLYQEFRDFFPDNAVSYFVSYYDYYQPEAYIPSTDTYIEKETNINDEIDKLRLSATTHLLTRPDVIVVASVSCIYNLGSPIEYGRYILEIIQGQLIDRQSIYQRLIELQYERSDMDLHRGSFKVQGETTTIWPAYADYALKLQLLDKKIEKIVVIDPTTGLKLEEAERKDMGIFSDHKFILYPAKHYLTNPKDQQQAISQIKADLKERLNWYKTQGKIVEPHRLAQKVGYDLQMIQEFGFTNGIENYSRYFDGRNPGQPPYTLIDYFHHNVDLFNQKGFLCVVDESHISLPQIRGMYRGDQSRKQTLIDFGFRLPSALDNRPLTYDEFQERIPQTVYVSATPEKLELNLSGDNIAEQLIRPTGLIDPEIEIRPVENQVPDLISEIFKRVELSQRVLVTTLTKRMAEDLTEYLNDKTKLKKILKLINLKSSIMPKVAYLHSDIDTLDRSDILDQLRHGVFDVLIGINLLREGLDLPEVSLVAILDADKEGFLRSRTSLIQTMGRAARHVNGRVIMYADKVTKSMAAAIEEVDRRRQVQLEYNRINQVTPISISKPIRKVLIEREAKEEPTKTAIKLSKDTHFEPDKLDVATLTPKDKNKLIQSLTRAMNQAAKDLDFEKAAVIRDSLAPLK